MTCGMHRCQNEVVPGTYWCADHQLPVRTRLCQNRNCKKQAIDGALYCADHGSTICLERGCQARALPGRNWCQEHLVPQANRVATFKPVKAEEIDPVMLAAQVDYWPQGLPPEGLAALRKDINIVTAPNGLFQIRGNQIGWTCTQLAKGETAPVGVRGEKMQEGFVLKIPKLPWLALAQTVAFFREVNKRHHAEAYIQWWFDPQANTYEPHVPLQDISGGRVEHEGRQDLTLQTGKVHAFDIHSHNTMGAFWSGTDDGDEQRYPRCYGVIGQIDKTIPASKWRVRAQGQAKFVDLTLQELCEIPNFQVPFTVELGILMNTPGADPVLTLPRSSGIDPFEGVQIPPEWWEPLIVDSKDKRRVNRGNGHAKGWDWMHRRGTSYHDSHLGGLELEHEDPPTPQASNGGGGSGAGGTEAAKTKLIIHPGRLPTYRAMARPKVVFRRNGDGYEVWYLTADGQRMRAPDEEERFILEDLKQSPRAEDGAQKGAQ